MAERPNKIIFKSHHRHYQPEKIYMHENVCFDPLNSWLNGKYIITSNENATRTIYINSRRRNIPQR